MRGNSFSLPIPSGWFTWENGFRYPFRGQCGPSGRHLWEVKEPTPMVGKQPCVATRGRNLKSGFGLILLTSTLFTLAPAFAQTSGPPRTSFEDQAAFLLSNGTLELTVLERGSTFAQVTLADDPGKLSPLWDPVRMAREAGEKPQPESAQGHFICVDGFGEVSPQEKAAGLPSHGEAHASTV